MRSRTGASIASSLDNEPILIVQLVRLAVMRIHAVLARRILAGATLRLDRLAALQAACPVQDPRRELRKSMIVEAKALSGVFRSGVADAKYYFSQEPQSGNLFALGIVRAVARPYLLREERLWLEIMSTRIEAFDRPRFTRGTVNAEPAVRSFDVLVRMMLRNLGGLEDRCDLAESRDRLVHAAIGIERRRLGGERLPARLDDAPVDPLTGRPFAYESDGTRWRIRSEADLSSMEHAWTHDPVLDWSHGE